MDMSISEQIADQILRRSGIFDNRASLILEVEQELASIYSELDNGDQSLASIDTPNKYYEEVETIFDLVANGEIHRTLYKLINFDQRAFIKKLTLNEDMYIDVRRGKGHDFKQYWSFNISANKKLGFTSTISFEFVVGVRDLFPYEIEMDSFLSEEESLSFLEYFKNL
jgi:hypothetical protein